MHKRNVNSTGFTIVELLIVIVVIAILATISVVMYTGVQARARDTIRSNDMAAIKKSLLAYDATYGGVVRPGAPTYTKPSGEPAMAGWDVSTSASWLSFLRPEYGPMPVDPVNAINNTGTITGVVGGNRIYAYYCYPPDHVAGLPGRPSAQIRYNDESGASVIEKFAVTDCLGNVPS